MPDVNQRICCSSKAWAPIVIFLPLRKNLLGLKRKASNHYFAKFQRLVLWYISWKVEGWREHSLPRTSVVPSCQRCIFYVKWKVQHLNCWQNCFFRSANSFRIKINIQQPIWYNFSLLQCVVQTAFRFFLFILIWSVEIILKMYFLF